MAHTRTWNAAYEATPPNNQNASQGAQRIRELKQDIRERLDLDHIMDDDDTDDGRHRFVALVEQAADPGNLALKGFVYTKDVGGLTEVFYMDAAGTVLQLTNNGKLLLLDTNNTWTKGQAMTEAEITFASTITPDAAEGNAFRVTLTANIILAAPINPISGQILTIRFLQDGTGGWTLSFSGAIFGNTNDDLLLSTDASKHDILTLFYNAQDSRWHVISLKKDINNAL